MSLCLRCRHSVGLLTAAVSAVLFIGAPVSAQPGEYPSSGLIRTDRYTLVRSGPTEDQVRPLEAVVNITFSPQVTTVGQALQELLQGSGYRLIHRNGEYGQPVDQVLMRQPLPATQYQLGPMSLRDALSTLGGPAWHLQSNEFGREVWFELDANHLEDSDRIRRLLSTTMVEKSSAGELEGKDQSRLETASTYLDFAPGRSGADALTPEGLAALNDWTAWYRANADQVETVSLIGESQSTGNHAREALAEARAVAIAELLEDAGIARHRITTSSVHKNHAAQDRQGVYLAAHMKPEVLETSPPPESGTTNARAQRAKDPSVVESPDIFYLYRGEDLEVALRRWASKAQYNDVVWNVRNVDGQFVRIPIQADAVFRGDLRQSLASLKEAYATAPRPLYLDIELRKGNKVLYVELLHYGD